MAPPKQAESTQTARKPIVRTKAWVQLEGGEQQPPEIINVDEIPSPDTTPVNPTPMVEETQQPASEGMNIDISAEEQGQQNQDANILKEAQPENTKGAPRGNGMATNHEAAVKLDESQTTTSDHV
jgi:hypothetical protein